MWSPTHAQVLVKRAKGLKIKGKNGSNDPFVTIGLGKEKFQTSVIEKSGDSVEWMEQCELLIPNKGNTAEVVLTVLHRNFLGVDEFLGRVSLPLSDFDQHEKPKSKWYPLECKPGQKKNDYRGDLEVRVGFTVIASDKVGGSVSDLSKKKKGSSSSINKVAGNIGGSLMSLGSKPKSITKLAGSVGHKIDKIGGKAKKSLSSLKLNKDKRNLDSLPEENPWDKDAANLDPGVNSDEEEDIDALFKKVGGSSLSLNRKPLENTKASPLPPSKPQRSLGVYQNEKEGNENLFKFDLKIEKQEFRNNRNSFTDLKYEPEIKEPFENYHETFDEDEKERKKRKKEKKDKRKEQEKENEIVQTQNLNLEKNTKTTVKTSTVDSPIITTNHNTKEHANEIFRSDNNKHFQTYSDEESEDFVVDDVIETIPSDSEEEVEVRQKDTHSVASNKDADDDTGDDDDDEEDDSLDIQSSSSEVTTVDTTKQQGRKVEKQNPNLDYLKLKGPDVENVQKSQIRPKHGVESFAESESEASEDSDDNGNEDTKPSTGGKNTQGKGKATIEEKLPLEIINKFNGKSREDLIRMVVNVQNTVEGQGKKITDLEAYIDTLLSRVIEVAPVLLHKDVKGGNRANGMQVFNRDLKRSKFG